MRQRVRQLVVAFSLLLAGCAEPVVLPAPVEGPVPAAARLSAQLPPRAAAQNFVMAVERVEPVAEQVCRARTRSMPCDFRIVIDDRPGQPPNAFQTLDRAGRPVIGLTLTLIAGARNVDEIAFVLGHEAAHHILGHLPQQRESAAAGAILAGVLATLGGGDDAAVRAAQDVGAVVGARRYSQDFELQADALGTQIAFRAGFDPVRGSAFFSRLPDPGNRFLGTHPPNAQRLATVRRAVAGLR
ncbi:MAG: M48 family metallopeptidase [Gemmobacter sp.]